MLGLAGLVAVAGLVRWYGTVVVGQYSLHHAQAPMVDLNQAGFGELLTIPGLGEALADRILVERSRHGPFRDASDLAQRVEGIGEKKVADLLGHAIIR